MLSSLELFVVFFGAHGKKVRREYWIPGAMVWGKTIMPSVSLVDYDDNVNVFCVLVYIVLIYAFVFLDILFIHIKLCI